MTVRLMRWQQRADTIQAGGIAAAIGNDVTLPRRCEELILFALQSPLRHCKRGNTGK